MRQRMVTYSTVLGAVAFLVPGVRAFCWPESFHRNVVLYDPFNLHLFHDGGAVQLGFGIALLGAVALALAAASSCDWASSGKPSPKWSA